MEHLCPRDGSVLHVPDAALWDWQTAPLLCDVCSQGFWLSELTPEARRNYHIKNRTYRAHIRATVKKEHEQARHTQTHSAEVHALLSPRQLEILKKRHNAPN